MPIEWKGPEPLPSNTEGHTHWFEQEKGIPDGFELVYPGTLEITADRVPKGLINQVDPGILGPNIDLTAVLDHLSDQPIADGSLSIPLLLNSDTQELFANSVSNNITGATAVFRRFGMPLLRPIPPENPLPFPKPSLRAGIERLIVVIDADIAFAHERFRLTPATTRLAAFWDMDATRSDLPYIKGRFMFENDINAYLNQLTQPGRGEAELYRDYIADSYSSPETALLPSVYGHGTHVLDMACGNNEPGIGHDRLIDDKTAIVAIQLPREAVAQTHGYFLSNYVKMGLYFAAAMSTWIGQNGQDPEVLVNISVGGHAGRHDGYSSIEEVMDEFLSPNGHLGKRFEGIFLPAGNSYDTRTHARISVRHFVEKGCIETCTWRIRPDDGTASFLEIWLPDDIPAGVHPLGLTITTPGGFANSFAMNSLVPGQYYELVDTNGSATTVLARLYVEDDPGGGSVRRRYLLAVRHTQLNRVAQGGYVGGRVDLAGDWKIELRLSQATGFAPADHITLWIARDDEILRFKSGARQSVFPEIDGALDQIPFEQDQAGNPVGKLDGVVDDGTISDMASGLRTSVIAAHLESDGTPAEYSGEGIDDDRAVVGRNIHPTVSAIADQSKAHPGLIGAGYFSGSSWRQGGTSVSSPLALRHMLDYPRTPGAVVKGMLIGKALLADPVLPNDPDRPTPSRIGAGRILATTEKLPHPVRRRASRS